MENLKKHAEAEEAFYQANDKLEAAVKKYEMARENQASDKKIGDLRKEVNRLREIRTNCVAAVLRLEEAEQKKNRGYWDSVKK